MSSVNQVLNTSSQATTNYDVSKIFLWENRYDKATYTNSSGSSVTLVAGTVLGRVSATSKVIPLQSDAVDGSQYPVGILANDVVVTAGDSVVVSFCNAGDVAKEAIVLVKAGDTLSTVVAGRQIGDRIAGDTIGIKLVAGTEMTAFDNQ